MHQHCEFPSSRGEEQHSKQQLSFTCSLGSGSSACASFCAQVGDELPASPGSWPRACCSGPGAAQTSFHPSLLHPQLLWTSQPGPICSSLFLHELGCVMERGREAGTLGTPGLFLPALGSNWDRRLGARTRESVLPRGGRVSGPGIGEELHIFPS